MATRHMEGYSTSSVIWKMQAKITAGFYFSPARMATAKHHKTTSAGENAEILEPLHAAVGNVKWLTTVKMSGSSLVS